MKLLNSNLIINVEENPIIENINYNGVKAKKILNEITKNLKMKARSSYNVIQLKKDKDLLMNNLQNLGYYFAKVETYVEQLDNNNINLNYQIDLGEKVKLKKFLLLVIFLK